MDGCGLYGCEKMVRENCDLGIQFQLGKSTNFASLFPDFSWFLSKNVQTEGWCSQEFALFKTADQTSDKPLRKPGNLSGTSFIDSWDSQFQEKSQNSSTKIICVDIVFFSYLFLRIFPETI